MRWLESMIRGIGSEMKQKKLHDRSWQFNQLSSSPFLHSAEYLDELYAAAKGNKDQEDVLLDHLYKFNNHLDGRLLDLECYKSVENKIIDKRWR